MQQITSSYGKHFQEAEYFNSKEEWEQYLREAAFYQYVQKAHKMYTKKHQSKNSRKQQMKKLNHGFETQQRSITCIMRDTDPSDFEAKFDSPLEAYNKVV